VKREIFKKTAILIIAAALCLTAIPNPAAAQTDILYEKSNKQTLTAGATLEHISRFTANGWLNINVLRIDLTNPNIKIDMLARNQITDKLDTVLALAQDHGAVAAVNAGFFTSMGNGTAYAEGTTVKGGELLSATGRLNIAKDEMASFSLTKTGQMLFGYWKNDLSLISPNNTVFSVAQYNQLSVKDFSDITVLDPKWGPFTLGSSDKHPDLTEIIVADGQVKEIRQAQPAAAIPANGYAIVSKGEQAAKLQECFRVGDPIKFHITSVPDFSQLQTSVTGASLLLQEGQIPKTFSFSTASFDKRNPRTLAGSTKDGKQLILVTVDGRQDNSIGLTQSESAELMLELGAYNALAFDGGGSTTMVARRPGTTSLQVENVPSEGALRPVANGIGIFSVSSPGTLAKLILETEDANVFVNTSRILSLKGVDQNYNPLEIDPQKIQWTVSGIKGTFSGNSFRPLSAGNGKITAKVDGLTAELNIRALNAPVRLELNPSKLDIPQEHKQTLAVTGYDQQGFAAGIQPEDVQWTVTGQIGTLEKGVFSASTVGTGYIKAAMGKVSAYCPVAVYVNYTETKDEFERDQYAFAANPQLARGSVQVLSEEIHGGQNSAQFIYDFYNTGKSDEVSLVFPGQGLQLDPQTSGLTVWIYSFSENSNRILGEVLDASGQKHQIVFADKMAWTGWKQNKASLSQIKEPAYLSRIYIQNLDPAATYGKIYLDDLSAEIKNHPDIAQVKVPSDTLPGDEANKEVKFTAGPANFRFSVLGTGGNPQNNPQKQLLQKLSNYINKNLDLAVYAGKDARASAAKVKKTTLATGSGYKSYHYKNSTFIQLDTGQGGLRRSDPKEWPWFFAELDKAKGSNIFVIMADDPANFINAKEGALLRDTLAEYREKTAKNVWVFYPGTTDQSQLDRGVRYISCSGFNNPAFSAQKPAAAKYLQVTVTGNNITYQFKPLSALP